MDTERISFVSILHVQRGCMYSLSLSLSYYDFSPTPPVNSWLKAKAIVFIDIAK